MAHFAILSCNEAGHLLSIGPVGQELVRRGHRVTIVSDASALPMARMLHLPLRAFDADQIAYPSTGRLWSTFPHFAAKAQIDMRIYIRWQAEVVLRLVPAALQELEVDGVLVDHTLAAGGTAAEHVKIPFVSIGAALLWNGEPGLPPVYTSWPYAPGHVGVWRNRLGYAGWDWFIRPTLNVINGYRARWKLPSLHGIDDTYSKLAQLSQMSPEFDFPRRQLADTCHYIGSLTADRHLTSDDEFPWERLNGRPLIVASLGTLADAENAPFFRRLVAACAGLDAQLVLALGKWHDEENDACVREGLGEVPDNVLVVDFAPQLALLDRAALLITHAGFNTVMESLSRAVPMIALPRRADQPAVAARVARSGTGLVGSFRHTTHLQLREMIRRVLTDDSFRRRSEELQQSICAAGGAKRAAEIAEEALTSRHPVRRPFEMSYKKSQVCPISQS